MGLARLNRFLDFREARVFVHILQLPDRLAYVNWCRNNKLHSLPDDPESVYANHGWISWKDYLGTHRLTTSPNRDRPKLFVPRIAKKYVSFAEAREYVHTLNLTSRAKYYEWYRQNNPLHIPSAPDDCYAADWIGWQDYLGYSREDRFLSYTQAKEYIQSLGITTVLDYRKWSKRPDRPKNIPARPEEYYKNKGWSGWHDFIGT